MANARTNSLHERLDVETRRAVERDLVEQPPDRETYRKVYEHYGLADQGVSIKALERYGGYLRAMARNRWIGDLADAITGQDLGDEISGVIRTRLLETLLLGEAGIGDLMKASVTEANIAQAQVKREQWEGKKRVAQKALAESEKAAQADPDRAIESLREAVRMIYGVETERAA